MCNLYCFITVDWRLRCNWERKCHLQTEITTELCWLTAVCRISKNKDLIGFIRSPFVVGEKRPVYKSLLCSIPTVKFDQYDLYITLNVKTETFFRLTCFWWQKDPGQLGPALAVLWRNARRLSHADKNDLKIKGSCRVFPGLDSLGFRRLVEWLSMVSVTAHKRQLLASPVWKQDSSGHYGSSKVLCRRVKI